LRQCYLLIQNHSFSITIILCAWQSLTACEMSIAKGSHITLETIYSGLSKKNLKEHYGDTATEQCLGVIAEINKFSVSDEMLQVMGQTGHQSTGQI